jgi:DNA-binding HxlR family transcriptional regulator
MSHLATGPSLRLSSQATEALDALSDRWTLLVLREAMLGVRRFGGMQRNLKISRSLLSDRLRKLVELGVLERRPYRSDPEWHEYHVTAAGEELCPAVSALTDWVSRHVDGDAAGDEALRGRLEEHTGGEPHRVEPAVVTA